jgi:hypothetical protein
MRRFTERCVRWGDDLLWHCRACNKQIKRIEVSLARINEDALQYAMRGLYRISHITGRKVSLDKHPLARQNLRIRNPCESPMTRSQQEWRFLVTTKNLHSALEGPGSRKTGIVITPMPARLRPPFPQRTVYTRHLSFSICLPCQHQHNPLPFRHRNGHTAGRHRRDRT